MAGNPAEDTAAKGRVAEGTVVEDKADRDKRAAAPVPRCTLDCTVTGPTLLPPVHLGKKKK